MDKKSQLLNEIKVRGGSILINPGTGAVLDATFKNAYLNVHQFCEDVTSKIAKEIKRQPPAKVTHHRHAANDYGEGRYCFRIYYNGRSTEIQMPGWELNEVRFVSGLNPFDFPRLYVDDSSWLWSFAVKCAVSDLLNKEDIDWDD